MTFRRQVDLLIVGGGPAGLAAAIEAGRSGLDAVLIEERPTLGGQIYKQFARGFRVTEPRKLGKHYAQGAQLIAEAQRSGVKFLVDTVVWGVWGKSVAVYQDGVEAGTFDADQVILATGAYDRPTVFPGWTLPGVISAGGAQSLVKTQKVVPGERILMAGSGPLILAFSAQLHQLGANVVGVLEAAPPPGIGAMARLLAAARGNVRLLADGVSYMAYLKRKRIPFLRSHIVVGAMEGPTGEVAQAVGAKVDRQWRPIAGTERRFDVDTICLGYGFFPSVELSRLCGCEHRYDENAGGHIPLRDPDMRSTVNGVLVAGDGAGVAGSLVAIAEGRLAGLTASLDAKAISPEEARVRSAPVRRQLGRYAKFRSALDGIYPVGAGVYGLWTDDTVVCRCEEVTAGELLESIVAESADPNAVKNVTRVGMGQCQGRNCSRQVASIIAQQAGQGIADVPMFSARPPVKPVPMELFMEERPEEERKAEVG
jgi:thioredoxin reductase